MRFDPHVKIIGAAIQVDDSCFYGCDQAPGYLLDSKVISNVTETLDNISYVGTVRAPKIFSPPKNLSYFTENLAEEVSKLTTGNQVWVIGGDHSCAVGTWKGIYRGLKEPSRFWDPTWIPKIGLIWIDAHFDCHNPETSKTGNLHGMPLATLLDEKFIVPQNTCIIGVRSFEMEELDLIESLGIAYYGVDEVLKYGPSEIMKEALKIARKEEGYFGVSIDLDVLDPSEFEFVNVPEERGLMVSDLLQMISHIRYEERFLGLELAEFNPTLIREGEDGDKGKALKVIEDILISAGISR